MPPADLLGMATSAPHDHDTTERVERYERERIVERPAVTTPAASNVNVGPTTTAAATNTVWAVTRVVTLLFTVLEVLLLLRFVLKLMGANANQPLGSGLYGVTEPLAAPTRLPQSVPVPPRTTMSTTVPEVVQCRRSSDAKPCPIA